MSRNTRTLNQNLIESMGWHKGSPLLDEERMRPFELYILFACLHCMLSNLSFFLHFFPYLSLPLRIDLHSFQPRGRKRQQNLRVLVVLVYFILLYFCVSDA